VKKINPIMDNTYTYFTTLSKKLGPTSLTIRYGIVILKVTPINVTKLNCCEGFIKKAEKKLMINQTNKIYISTILNFFFLAINSIKKIKKTTEVNLSS
jgi:hypothetical protein